MAKNYNYLALRGQDLDDMDVVEQYGLDPSVAYTPAINEAAIEAQRKLNYDMYLTDGMDEAKAMKKAKQNAALARRNIKRLMK